MAENIALVVDDTPANRDFLERLLAQAKFTVRGAENGEMALKAVNADDNVVLAVVDMKLPDMTGLELTEALRQRYPGALVVIATMYDEKSLMQQAFQKGCNVFLVKPYGFMELFKRLTTASIDDLCKQGFTIIDQYGPRAFHAMK
jgi:CheY-like chemotaxis protein